MKMAKIDPQVAQLPQTRRDAPRAAPTRTHARSSRAASLAEAVSRLDADDETLVAIEHLLQRRHALSQVGPDLRAEVERVLRSSDKASGWLVSPNGALDGEAPAVVAGRPGGEARVREVLTRIEYGIFS